MSTRARGGGGGGGRQFPVGRRRYVPVVDAGCGCRPRRPRLLSLPSFLKPCQLGGNNNNKAAARRGGSGGEQYSSCASTSTAASFSSSSAATRSTGYSSANSSDYYYHHHPSSHVLYGDAAAAAKQQQEAPPSPRPKQQQATKAAPAPAGKRQLKAAKTKKKRYEKTAGPEGDGVGVAVEKESSDPRADFRDSMVQMVVEMGLCDWDGLRGMLRRLLALNAPRHHAAILAAFAEVCAQLTAPPPHPAYHAYDYHYHY